MRRKSWSTSVGVMLAAMASITPAASFGQQPPVQPGSFYLLRADGNIVLLPSIKGKMKAHTNALKAAAGIIHQKVVVDIPGQACSVRLRAGDPQAFLSGATAGTTYMAPPDYRQLPETLAPGLYAELQELAVVAKSGKRELVIDDTKGNVFTAASGKVSTTGAPAIGMPLNFSRYASLVVKSEPRAVLPPGEYAFVCTPASIAVGCQTAPSTDIYASPALAWDEYQFACFGIDP